jgi:hypothetical protein
MVTVKRLVLDVLKPHQPSALDFCRRIAQLGADYEVCLNVEEVDENTQTLSLDIRGGDVDMGAIEAAIADMGASLHSVDKVEVHNEEADGEQA